MTLAHFPAYGHAFCPHCEAEFDLAQAAPTFGERFRKECCGRLKIDQYLRFVPTQN